MGMAAFALGNPTAGSQQPKKIHFKPILLGATDRSQSGGVKSQPLARLRRVIAWAATQ
jgi:hypothetical protein